MLLHRQLFLKNGQLLYRLCSALQCQPKSSIPTNIRSEYVKVFKITNQNRHISTSSIINLFDSNKQETKPEQQKYIMYVNKIKVSSQHD